MYVSAVRILPYAHGLRSTSLLNQDSDMKYFVKSHTRESRTEVVVKLNAGKQTKMNSKVCYIAPFVNQVYAYLHTTFLTGETS